ncbi:hypothetical protein QVD99_006440 [Batrachochytrium dendrobatidis]|nr:hypothetical protein QVD99_006440 [Batrachochytrium dendrobatidis]
MSGHNTPISTAHSFLSLNTPRVSVEATINSDLPGLKTLLVEYFSGARLFAKIQRTDTGITQAIVQGHPKQFPSSLEYLRELLQIKYDAAIVWGEASAVSKESRYNSITIEEALPTLERDPSSGEFLEKELDEISFGGSAATEALKKVVKETFASMANATTGFGIAKGWIPAVPEEHITVKRGDEEYDLEVSIISSLSALIEAVQKKFPLALKVKKLYRLHEGTPVVVTDVKDLIQGYLYYVLAGFEEFPKKQTTKFTTMEEFFDKLKIQQELDDDEIQLIKDCLGKQKVKFTQLMATGDLALTDEKLKEIGISQLVSIVYYKCQQITAWIRRVAAFNDADLSEELRLINKNSFNAFTRAISRTRRPELDSHIHRNGAYEAHPHADTINLLLSIGESTLSAINSEIPVSPVPYAVSPYIDEANALPTSNYSSSSFWKETLPSYRENQSKYEPSESPSSFHSFEEEAEGEGVATGSEMVISTSLSNLNI